MRAVHAGLRAVRGEQRAAAARPRQSGDEGGDGQGEQRLGRVWRWVHVCSAGVVLTCEPRGWAAAAGHGCGAQGVAVRGPAIERARRREFTGNEEEYLETARRLELGPSTVNIGLLLPALVRRIGPSRAVNHSTYPCCSHAMAGYVLFLSTLPGPRCSADCPRSTTNLHDLWHYLWHDL